MRWILLFAVSCLGCNDLWGGFRGPHAGGVCESAASCRGASFSARPEFDLLFVIDNSYTMFSKQATFARAMPTLLDRLDALGADYHLAITSTDVGTWPAGKSFPRYRSCESRSGDDGAFQALPCTSRPMSAEAKAQCASLCPDPSFVPTDGLDFLYRSGGYGNAPKSLVGDRDVGVQRAFQCLAILGDQGCEIEGPFEAARRALDGHQLRNGPFLHSRGHLALFFLTDEDDCSVAEARRDENDPTQLVTCPMAGSDADYRCFTPDFRCLAQSVVCTEPLTKAGAKTRCQTRPSYLEPVESYAQFLQGLRPAEKVAVFGIWPPALGLPGTRFEVEVEPGGNLANTFELNRASLDLASCANKAAGVFGRPQLRLSQLAAQFPGGEVDLCKGGGDYQLGMVEAASRLRRLAVNCLPFVPRTDGGRPLCQVGDLADEAGPGPAETFPACRAGCCAAFAASNVPAQVEPEIALACQGEEKTCFCAVASAQPGICSGGVVAAVFRKGEAPANQITNFTCAIP